MMLQYNPVIKDPGESTHSNDGIAAVSTQSGFLLNKRAQQCVELSPLMSMPQHHLNSTWYQVCCAAIRPANTAMGPQSRLPVGDSANTDMRCLPPRRHTLLLTQHVSDT